MNPGLPVNRKRSPYTMATLSWSIPALLFLFVFFLFPLVGNVFRSSPADGSGIWALYHKLFFDSYYFGVFLETIKVSVITTIACLIVGYPIAYYMVRYARRWNSVLLFLLIAPLLTSIIMRTFGWDVILSRSGLLNRILIDLNIISSPLDLVNEPIAVYIGLVHVLVPFMVLSITSVLQGIDQRLEESARSLGAGPVRTFTSITLPLSTEGIITGCILVFVLTNGSFLTMLLLGGGKVTTLALLIYQQFNVTQDIGFAAAMGNVLLLFALACLMLQSYLVRRKGRR